MNPLPSIACTHGVAVGVQPTPWDQRTCLSLLVMSPVVENRLALSVQLTREEAQWVIDQLTVAISQREPA